MYRPLKDLDGIPGAKDLIMCLTGYLRQDRDDIMVSICYTFVLIFSRSLCALLCNVIWLHLVLPLQTMVGLMGAQFSKPLVANKVTHLICYKFEGLFRFLKFWHHIQLHVYAILFLLIAFYYRLFMFMMYFILFVHGVLKFYFQYRREVWACQEIGHNKVS